MKKAWETRRMRRAFKRSFRRISPDTLKKINPLMTDLAKEYGMKPGEAVEKLKRAGKLREG